MLKLNSPDYLARLRQIRPLENYLILESIFKHLSDSEKRKARLVCETWNAQILQEFRKGIPRSTKKWIELDLKKTACIPNHFEYDFKKLDTLLMNSSAPELLMEFIHINKLECAFRPVTEAHICFKYYGMYIKSLRINDLGSVNHDRMHQIMYTVCPNLVNLHIGMTYYNYGYDHAARISNPIGTLEWSQPLKSLQALTIEDGGDMYPMYISMSKEDSYWLSGLIKAAKSLKYFKIGNKTLENAILSTEMNNKNAVLKEITALQFYEEIYDDPLLDELTPFLNKLKISNIEELYMHSSYQKSCNYPIMTKLKSFSALDLLDPGPDERLQISRLMKSFPNLESLEMKVGFYDNLLRSINTSADTLFQSIYDPNVAQEKDKICFPNITVFKLYAYWTSYSSLQKMCSVFPNLKSLSFKFFLSNYTSENVILQNIAETISSLKDLEFLEAAIIWTEKDAQVKDDPKFVNKLYENLRRFLLAPQLKSFRLVWKNVFPYDLVNNLRTEFPKVRIIFDLHDEDDDVFIFDERPVFVNVDSIRIFGNIYYTNTLHWERLIGNSQT